MTDKPERTLKEKLNDANSALRSARQELGRAIQQRDQANGFVASRRVKVDQLESWAATLQAQFDARVFDETMDAIAREPDILPS